MKLLRKILIIILISTFSYIVLSSIGENIVVYKEIYDFKKSCSFYSEKSTRTKQFYTVSRETELPSFKYDNSLISIGSPLDIIVKLDSTYNFPVFHEVVSFTIGGHAALVCDDYIDSNYDIQQGELIETASNSDHNEVFVSDALYWEDPNFTESYVVLRVKLTDDEKIKVMNQAVSYIGDPYNMSFLFNTKNSHYCSDLITKCFKAVDINLNYDGFATTIYDLIVSDKTKIVGYKEYDKTNGISSYYGVNL